MTSNERRYNISRKTRHSHISIHIRVTAYILLNQILWPKKWCKKGLKLLTFSQINEKFKPYVGVNFSPCGEKKPINTLLSTLSHTPALSNTITQVHFHSFMISYFHTFMISQFHIFIFSHFSIFTLTHCNTHTQTPTLTLSLSHFSLTNATSH